MTMPVKDAPFLEERTAAVMESVFNDPIVKKALEQAVPQEIFTIEEQIEICEVPAPPMKEQTRAAMIAEKINSYGLEASIDPVGNVIACRKGTDPDGPVCVISAHMDNSFREGTDTTVRRQNGRLVCARYFRRIPCIGLHAPSYSNGRQQRHQDKGNAAFHCHGRAGGRRGLARRETNLLQLWHPCGRRFGLGRRRPRKTALRICRF